MFLLRDSIVTSRSPPLLLRTRLDSTSCVIDANCCLTVVTMQLPLSRKLLPRAILLAWTAYSPKTLVKTLRSRLTLMPLIPIHSSISSASPRTSPSNMVQLRVVSSNTCHRLWFYPGVLITLVAHSEFFTCTTPRSLLSHSLRISEPMAISYLSTIFSFNCTIREDVHGCRWRVNWTRGQMHTHTPSRNRGRKHSRKPLITALRKRFTYS